VRLIRTAFVLLAFFCYSSASNANGIDLRLSSDAAELTFLSESSTFGYGGADIGFGVFFDDNDNLILNGNIIVSGSGLGNLPGLNFGVGIKAYAGTIDIIPSQTGGAVAIGVTGRYVIPGVVPMAVMVEAYVAPSVSSLADFDGVSEFRVGLEVEVTPSARAYVGYRDFEVDTNIKSGLKVDDAIHFGVRFSY